MGKWMNVAFVQTEDLGRLEAAVERLIEGSGRHQVRPPPRTPEPYEPMQYGHGEDVPRWGLAGFLASPGWCALRSAPYELLMGGEAPFLARITEQLGTVGFQLDRERGFRQRCNLEMVELESLVDESEIWLVHGMIERHFQHTGSTVARVAAHAC